MTFTMERWTQHLLCITFIFTQLYFHFGVLNAQMTTTSKRCTLQDGSKIYNIQLKDVEDQCLTTGELQEQLKNLTAQVSRKTLELEKKIYEGYSTLQNRIDQTHGGNQQAQNGTVLILYQQLTEQIQDIKQKQQLLQGKVDETVRYLGQLSGIHKKCPPGFHQNQTSCYKFVEHASKWFEAELFCMMQGAHLVSIETQEENEYLHAHLRSIPTYSPYSFWTGGNDIEHESMWVWAASTEAFIISPWAPGEPTNSGSDQTGQSGSEQCMAIHASYGWNDMMCTTTTYFICELPLEIENTSEP